MVVLGIFRNVWMGGLLVLGKTLLLVIRNNTLVIDEWAILQNFDIGAAVLSGGTYDFARFLNEVEVNWCCSMRLENV